MNLDYTREIKKIMSSTGTKVYIYFAKKEAGDDYDSREQNYTYTNMNPKCIKAIVRMISPEALVWKQYGLAEMGAVQIICDEKFYSWFKTCNRIVIEGADYSVFRVGSDNRVLIQKQPGELIRVTLERKG